MSVNLDYLQDCNRARPDWTPEDGVASPVLEALILLNTPIGYVWIAILALFLWKRDVFSGALVAACSLGLLGNWVAMYALHDDLHLGGLGGCVGSLSVTITVLSVASLFGLGTVVHRLRDR